ncbi:PREDICTED: LOW QUALITY PROTEIN: TPR and ankyrin repeat-containing protein 1-like [Branchiostoma belcheri]|uniref:LOW QUALITY PROTEIN: TPR and ankyrin repeat-containing protein 1-like n=1 Tax=Branchiostoma belcheri TaxID=7741 RepID=A0A6P4YN84_BRABE|nr:PREDICTED: LOW QUALITY PROTEIN: TPR and ankyrin repeat-containing protein 1-like [Branchiostoma belcheri]
MAGPWPFLPPGQADRHQQSWLKSEVERIGGHAMSMFRQGDYFNAAHRWSEAIRYAELLGQRSTIAQLLLNRSTCAQRIGREDLALSDAEEAIRANPAWLKGYLKAGLSAFRMKCFDRALGLFRDGFLKAVELNRPSQKEPLDFLIHMAEAIHFLPGVRVEHILQTIRPAKRLRTMLVEQLVVEKKWHLLRAVFFGGGAGHRPNSGGIATGGDMSKINLAPILWIYWAQPLQYIRDTVCVLLQHGSGLEGFSLEPGDTPMHALLNVELKKGDDSLQMMTLVCESLTSRFINALKATDAKGNTLLHVVTMADRERNTSKRCALRAIGLLLEVGLDPDVCNTDGKKAADHARKGSDLFSCLENGRGEARGASNSFSHPPPAQTQLQPGPSQPHVPSQMSKAKVQKTKLKAHMTPLDKARKLIQEGKSMDALKIFARTISEAKLKEDGDMTTELLQCLEGIAHAMENIKGVPRQVVVLAPLSMWRGTVAKLSSQKKWRTLGMLLTGGGNYHNAGDGGLATGCDTTCVPLMQVFRFFEGKEGKQSGLKMHSVIRELLKGGASPDGDDSDTHPISYCLQSKDFATVQMLLEHGADLSKLTLREGDTSLHAAVQIAKEGNSGILNLLDNKGEVDHRTRDSNGNSLLHVAVKGKYSMDGAKLLERLLKMGVDPSVKNNEGMTPLDYLKEGDRRRQLLEPHMKKQDSSTKSQDNNAKDANSKGSKIMDERVTSEHAGKTADSWEDAASGDNNKSTQAKRQTSSSQEQKKSAREDIKSRILDSILTIPLPNATETEERLLRRVRQKSYQTTTPVASTRPNRDQDKLENRDEKTTADPSLYTVAQEAQLPQSCWKPEEGEELPDTSYDVFDKDLPWEVECTDKVKKILKKKAFPYEVKKRVVEKVNRLAKGEWINNLTKKVRGRPQEEGMQLFEAKIDKASRILWELAIAFSPRLSDNPIEWLKGVQEAEESTTLAPGGRIYTEIIRIWDIVLDHDNLERAIDQAVTSFMRGKASMPIAKKSLVGSTSRQFKSAPATTDRLPMLFTEKDITTDRPKDIPEKQEQQFFPAASSNENEYNILKFYCFSSSLVNNILRDDSLPVEFPFKVTDLEHAIVHLKAQPPSSILLLGRSGTGKTTCCLFRLWYAYLSYWTKSAAHGFEPWVPKSKAYIQRRNKMDDKDDDEEEEGESEIIPEDSGSEEEVCTKSKKKVNDKDSLGHQTHHSETLVDSSVQKIDEEDESLHTEMTKRDWKEPEPTENLETGEQEFEHLHQIFVTKNAVLCSEVGKNFQELCHGTEAAQKYLEANQDEKIPVRLQDVDPAGFPLFLDSRQWLLMLDASLEEPHFFKRADGGQVAEEVPGWMENDGPATFIPTDSDLEDDSSDDEEDMEGGKELDKLKAAIVAAEDSGRRQQERRTMRQEVTYEVFCTELWKRVNRGKVDYHPTLVWMEIMSIIKGSVEAVETNEGHLSREEYLEIGKKRAEFTGDRDKIYDIFLAYQHEKRQRHMFDEMDFVHNLYKRLAHAEDVGWSIHQVYVDETQDFTQAELALLIRCCCDPNEMFFTGDTAQSIMRGVSFRFKDLRSLFHKARESLQQMGKRTAVQVPDMYHLTHNYRSHCGILDLAAGVIKLLESFFPYSFDHLPKDRGIMEGPKPLLLQGCSQKDLVTLLQGNRRATSTIEFGAHQVVLVANNEAKEDMPDVFRGSLVLTIYESKGLEFDDVLLYNIFKDSQADEEWRVVLTCMDEDEVKASNTEPWEKSEGLLKIANDQSSAVAQARPLDFNPEKHKVLNSELKNLYTAITRARVNVWIFDEDTAKHAPMFKYFLEKQFVEEPQRDELGQLSSSVFVKESTPEEWCQRGEYFYKKERWEIAADFFKKGGDEKKAKMALAQHLAQQASQDATMTREKHRIRQRFLDSADLFLQSGNHVDDREALVRAARCLTNSRDYRLAAQLFERLGEFSSAAHLYQRESMKVEASRCFVQAGNFKKAVNFLRSVDEFEAAANVSQQYIQLQSKCKQEGLNPTVVMTAPIQTPDNLLLEAIAHYHRHGEEDKKISCLNRLPVDTRLTFFTQHGYVKEAAELLKKEGRGQEAAELLKSVGDFEAAGKAADQDQNPQFVAECLLIQSRKQRKDATDNIQETKDNLITCMVLYQKSGNNEARAEAMMMLGDLTDDHTMLNSAIKHFGNNTAGALEAAALLVNRKKTLTFGDIRLILTLLEDVFSLIRALLVASRRHKVKDHHWVKACELFYGVKRTDVSSATFSSSEEPRIFDALDFSGRSKSTTKVDIETARACMAGDLLRNVDQLKEGLTKKLRSIVTSCQVCCMYTAGLSCPKGDVCAYLHHPYDKGTLNSLLQATIYLIKVQGLFDLGYEQIKDSKWERVQQAVASHKDRGADKSRLCDDLYSILFPTHGHQRILTENFRTAKDVFHKFQGDAIVMSCIRDYAQSLWESASHSDKRSNTDLLIKIANLFRLAKDPPVGNLQRSTFASLLASAEEGYKKWAMKRHHPEKIPRHIGMCCNMVGPSHLFFSFMRRMEEFIENIYQRENILSSIDNMMAFMGLLAKRALEPLIPSFANTCFFMELLVVICYSIYAKMNQHELLCLPASYISMVHMCDRLWSRGKGCIYSAIQQLPYKKDEILGKVNNCIWFIIDTICQSQKFPDFNAIDDAFRPNIPDYAESGEMERVFILALVLICGCGGPVPKNAEVPLRKALYKIGIKKHFPKRLADATRGMRSAKGIRDVVLLLQELLKARDQEYLRHCCWKYPDRMTRGIYRGLNFDQVKPDMFIGGFWRKITMEFHFYDDDAVSHANDSSAQSHDDDVVTPANSNSVSAHAQTDRNQTSNNVLVPQGSADISEVAEENASQVSEEDDLIPRQDEDDVIVEDEFEEEVDDGTLVMDDPTLAEGQDHRNMYEKILQQQAEERRQSAACKIQQFWRTHRKVGMMETPTHGTVHIAIDRQMSVEQDDLREFKVDNTGCRICGVTFESRPHIRDDVEEQEEGQERNTFEEAWDADPDGMKAEEEDVDKRDIITREKHLQDPMHSANLSEFGHFKQFYTSDVARVRKRYDKFISEANDDKGNEGAVMSEVQKVNTAHNSLQKLLEKIKDECTWNKRQDAYKALHALQDALVAFRSVKRLIERQADEEEASVAFVDEEAEEFRNLDEDDFIAVGGKKQRAKGKGGRQRKKRIKKSQK